MSRRTDFISWLKSHIGDMYVWGADGEMITGMDSPEQWVHKKETSVANANRAIEFMKAAAKNPLYAFDCSGLIVAFLLERGYIESDMSSRGLYRICEPIDREDLEAGDLVFRHNGERIHHVGVFVGDNMVIESKGRDDGVVFRDINASGKSYWNRYGRLSFITDEEVPDSPIVVTMTDPMMRGAEIKVLQTALNSLGYDCGKADGIAGKKTIAAIARFVEAHDVDGEDVPDTVPSAGECYIVIGGRKFKGDIEEV